MSSRSALPRVDAADPHAPESGPFALPIDTTAAVLHDLNCPLAAITMNLEFALTELPAERRCDDVREALEDCRTASAKMHRMLLNLFDVVQAERGVLELRTASVNVREWLDRVASGDRAGGLRRGRDPDISVQTAGYDGRFELDPELMGRALDSLLDETVGSAPAGALIVLKAELEGPFLVITVPMPAGVTALRPRTPPREARASWAPGTRLRGPAQADAALERSFGLYFVRRVLEAHGGGLCLRTGDMRGGHAALVARIPTREGSKSGSSSEELSSR